MPHEKLAKDSVSIRGKFRNRLPPPPAGIQPPLLFCFDSASVLGVKLRKKLFILQCRNLIMPFQVNV